MYIVLMIVVLIACVLLTFVVVIQKPKGGGIASNFAAGNQVLGVNKTSDVVEKATWVLAGSMLGIALLMHVFLNGSTLATTNDPNGATDVERATQQAPRTTAPTPVQQQTLPAPGSQAPAGNAAPTPQPAPADSGN